MCPIGVEMGEIRNMIPGMNGMTHFFFPFVCVYVCSQALKKELDDVMELHQSPQDHLGLSSDEEIIFKVCPEQPMVSLPSFSTRMHPKDSWFPSHPILSLYLRRCPSRKPTSLVQGMVEHFSQAHSTSRIELSCTVNPIVSCPPGKPTNASPCQDQSLRSSATI